MEFVIFWLICAGVTAAIASSKGRSGFGWFLIGALIGIFGIILIACLPSLKGRPGNTYYDPETRTIGAPPTSTRRIKSCPQCAEEVLADAKICRFCRHEFASART
ncbi:zinc ribbon domain-containing protein [Mesorhizobium sp. M0830]|uniref:zinc ribbon domain-containing protein n=1 Tax=Mesorhizobium sp. M0830 TaxID=2957008 RepID=UPI00333C8611